MANIKRTRKDGSLLVGYRPFPGQPEKYGVCPGRKEFEAFEVVERQHHRDGVEVPNPNDLYRPEPAPAEEKHRDMTLRAWIGQPSADAPGEYFDYARDMGADRPGTYEQVLRDWVSPYLLDDAGAEPTMRKTKRAHILKVVRAWLVCPACEARAKAKGLELTDRQLSVTRRPFDGKCVAEDFEGEEESTHYPRLRRSSMQRYLALLGAAYNVGSHCDDPVCSTNPVTGYQLPKFEEKPSNEDQTKALDHVQLLRLAEGHPDHLRAVPQIMAYGLLRRAETFGLNRADITWPGPDDHGVAHLEISRVYIRERAAGYVLRPWGKTEKSTFPVELARPAAEWLRRHMDSFRSTPAPLRCKACAEGVREWAGQGRNPHRRCDFADDAPVFVDLDGNRQNPGDYSGTIFPNAVAAVPELAKSVLGFVVNPKTLRATGGTLLLELGVPDDVVMKMGRWTNIATLKRHYFKMRDASRHAAARKLGEAAAAELGYELPDDAPVDLRLRAVEHRALRAEERAQRAEKDLERLRLMVVELGGDPTLPEPVRRVANPGVWTDDDKLHEAIDGATNQREILQRLGVSAAGKHYRKLEAAAGRLGLEIPGRWGKPAA